MLFRFTPLVVAAGLLASAGALSSQDIPIDVPVASLLDSAQTHLSRGETSEALTYYDAAIARDPTNYLTLFKRATTYLSLGRTAQATDDFNKVLALKPGFQGAHLQLAKIKVKSAEWDAARSEFLAAGKSADSQEISDLDIAKESAAAADQAARNGNWEDCVAHAGIAIFTAPRSSNLRNLRSTCRFERSEFEEAMSDLQHVLHMKPGDTTPHLVISATTFYGLGDMDTGIAQVKKCLQSDPDSKVCKRLHKQQKAVQKTLSKAEAQLNRGQTTTAGRTLVGTEDDAGLYATVQQQVEDLRQVGHIPAKVSAKLNHVILELICQAYSESSHKDAGKYCTEALELDPDSFWGLFYRGKKLLKEEEFEAAIQTLEKAGESHPEKRDKLSAILNKARIALKRSKTKDYYKVLSVANDADARQIKSAYRKATKQYHPDKAATHGINKEEAEKKMAAINEAYEVLSDPELRARFDRGDDPNSQEQGNPFQGSPFGHGGQPFMYQQGGGGAGGFKFHFGGGGGGPFGFYY